MRSTTAQTESLTTPPLGRTGLRSWLPSVSTVMVTVFAMVLSVLGGPVPMAEFVEREPSSLVLGERESDDEPSESTVTADETDDVEDAEEAPDRTVSRSGVGRTLVVLRRTHDRGAAPLPMLHAPTTRSVLPSGARAPPLA